MSNRRTVLSAALASILLIPVSVCGSVDSGDSGASEHTLKKLPVKYGGPIVFSKAPPPVIYFPEPPKVSQQELLGSATGSADSLHSGSVSPKQVEYVPLPFEDLPILIYKSTDSPPIHVVSPGQSDQGSDKDQQGGDGGGDLRGEASESASSSRYEARRLSAAGHYPRSYRDTSSSDHDVAYRDLAADLFAALTRQIGYKSNPPTYVEAPDPPKPVFVSSSSRPSPYQARGTYRQMNAADYASYQGGGRSSSSSASAPHIVYTGHPPIHLYTSPIIIKGNSEMSSRHQDFGEYADASDQKPVAVAGKAASASTPLPVQHLTATTTRGRKVGETILNALSTLGIAANPFMGPSRTITGLRRPSFFGSSSPSWASALGLTGSSVGQKLPFRFSSSASGPAASASNMNYAFVGMNPALSSYFGNAPSGSSNSYQESSSSRPSSNPFAALFGGSSGSSSGSGSRFRLSNLLRPSSSNSNPFTSILSAYGLGPAAENLSPFETGYALGTLSNYGFPFTPQSSSGGGGGGTVGYPRPNPFMGFSPGGDLSFSGSTKHATFAKPPRGIGHAFSYNQKSRLSSAGGADDGIPHPSASYPRARYRVPPTAATAAPRHHKPPIIIYQGVRPPVHIYNKQDALGKGVSGSVSAEYVSHYSKLPAPTYHPPQMLQDKPSGLHYASDHHHHGGAPYSDPDPDSYGNPSSINDPHEKYAGSMYGEKALYDSPPYGDKSAYPEKLLYQDKYEDHHAAEDAQQYGNGHSYHQQPNYASDAYGGNGAAEYAGDGSVDIEEYVESQTSPQYQPADPTQNNYSGQQQQAGGFSQSTGDHSDGKSWIPLQNSNSYAEAHSLSGLQITIQGSPVYPGSTQNAAGAGGLQPQDSESLLQDSPSQAADDDDSEFESTNYASIDPQSSSFSPRSDEKKGSPVDSGADAQAKDTT